MDNKLDMVFGSSKEEGIFFGWDYRGGGTSTGLEMYWKGVLNLAFRNGTTLFHNPDGIFNQRSSDQINEILDDSMAITSDEIDELINEVDNDDGTGTTTTQATLFLSGARVTRNELSKNSSSNTVTFNFEATFSDVSNLGTGIIRIPAGYIPSQTTSVTYNWTMSSTQKQYACDGEVTTNGILYVSTNNIPIPETYGASGKTTLSATWQTA